MHRGVGGILAAFILVSLVSAQVNRVWGSSIWYLNDSGVSSVFLKGQRQQDVMYMRYTKLSKKTESRRTCYGVRHLSGGW